MRAQTRAHKYLRQYLRMKNTTALHSGRNAIQATNIHNNSPVSMYQLLFFVS